MIYIDIYISHRRITCMFLIRIARVDSCFETQLYPDEVTCVAEHITCSEPHRNLHSQPVISTKHQKQLSAHVNCGMDD